MPQYYFHVERHGQRILDEEGSCVSNLQAAQEFALRSAADLAADALRAGAQNVEMFIVVKDAAGQDVVRVRVAATVEVQSLD